MRKNVRVDYTVRDDIALDEVTAAIREFVAGIAAHDPDHRYVSYQHATNPRSFTHVGSIAASRLADLQAQPFFGAFGAFLRARTERGPEVIWLEEVATAR